MGLGYPVLLGINLLFILFWLLKLDRRILLSAVVIALGFFHLQALYQMEGSNKVVNATESFRISTFNVRMFNHYDWLADDAIADKIALEIEQLKPDLLFLQEYYKTDKVPELDFKFKHVRMTNVGENYGLVIYSNFPILESGITNYNDTALRENNEFIFADIKIHDKTYRCINAHLASVGLGKTDYKRLDNPTEGTQKDIEQGFMTIAKRVGKAFERRESQTNRLLRAIESSPYPVVLAGDFNDTPSSHTYHSFEGLLKDSFLEAGNGFSKTYIRSKIIPLRIDYIFHDIGLRAFNYSVSNKELSDHYAVTVDLEIIQ
jgi:endonuclease/exonuclease/phosphatase family metal-dependent hydrolase